MDFCHASSSKKTGDVDIKTNETLNNILITARSNSNFDNIIQVGISPFFP